MLKSISVKDFRQKMSDALNRVAYGGENIAITRRGEIVAVLVSYQDLQELRKLRDQPVSDDAFEAMVDGIMDKNEKLYKRLAK
jgi:prevent-host-death family protein